MPVCSLRLSLGGSVGVAGVPESDFLTSHRVTVTVACGTRGYHDFPRYPGTRPPGPAGPQAVCCHHDHPMMAPISTQVPMPVQSHGCSQVDCINNKRG
eukprot:3940888-Rhodomonas_salina.3